MQRDMDLVRAILLTIAEHPHGDAPHPLHVSGYSPEQIGFHVHLLGQAGFLQTADTTTMGSQSPSAIAISMTWQGYEFLESARDPSRWAKAMTLVKEKGLPFTFDVLKVVLGDLAKLQLGLNP